MSRTTEEIFGLSDPFEQYSSESDEISDLKLGAKREQHTETLSQKQEQQREQPPQKEDYRGKHVATQNQESTSKRDDINNEEMKIEQTDGYRFLSYQDDYSDPDEKTMLRNIKLPGFYSFQQVYNKNATFEAWKSKAIVMRAVTRTISHLLWQPMVDMIELRLYLFTHLMSPQLTSIVFQIDAMYLEFSMTNEPIVYNWKRSKTISVLFQDLTLVKSLLNKTPMAVSVKM